MAACAKNWQRNNASKVGNRADGSVKDGIGWLSNKRTRLVCARRNRSPAPLVAYMLNARVHGYTRIIEYARAQTGD